MIHVFDTSSFRELQHFYPAIFKSMWPRLDSLVHSGKLVSTKEALRELEDQNVSKTVLDWCRANRSIFTVPSPDEQAFVRQILAIPHFQTIIGNQAILRGRAVADPFVIAKAYVVGGTVVSEERLKPNAAKIPNVCAHFGITCASLEGFMTSLGWSF